MSQAITLAYEVAAIRRRYQSVHDGLFRSVFRRKFSLPRRHSAAISAAHEEDLRELGTELERVRSALRALSDDELTKRSGKEIRELLCQYCDCLQDAVLRLEGICSCLRRERDGDGACDDYRTARYLSDVVAYEASVQRYRELGKRLERLFSTF